MENFSGTLYPGYNVQCKYGLIGDFRGVLILETFRGYFFLGKYLSVRISTDFVG